MQRRGARRGRIILLPFAGQRTQQGKWEGGICAAAPKGGGNLVYGYVGLSGDFYAQQSISLIIFACISLLVISLSVCVSRHASPCTSVSISPHNSLPTTCFLALGIGLYLEPRKSANVVNQ